MIIVEGLDGTGKTTLVSRLMDEFPGLQYKASIGTKHDAQFIRDQAEAEAYQYRANVISDRSRIISEYVYRPVLQDRELAYPVQDWLRYMAAWIDRPQCLIYCMRPLEYLEIELAEDEQREGVVGGLLGLQRGYQQMLDLIDWLFRRSPRGHQIVTYDYEKKTTTFDPYEEVTRVVTQYLSEQGEDV